MKSADPPSPPEFLTREQARRAGWKLKASFCKYLAQRKRYPLFTIRASRGGILANRELLRSAKLCKTVAYAGTYRYSLTTPRWPSAPFDRMVAGGGLNLTACGSPRKRQIDMAILAITSRCGYRCRHCYENLALAPGEALPIGRWENVIRELQGLGTSIIVLSGGEPLLRVQGISELLRSADHGLSEFHLHTSGAGLDESIAASLRRDGLVAAGVGLDDFDPQRHDRLRGVAGAFATAVRACRTFAHAGIFTYLNTCLTPALVRTGGLPRLLELAADLRVGIVRLLEPRSCGKPVGYEGGELFGAEDRRITAGFHETANTSPAYRKLPLVSYEAYIEHPSRLGCRMGGLSHLAVDARGNVLPCVFLPVSFGNIEEESFAAIFGRMREAVPRPIRKTCPAVSLAPLLREKIAASGEAAVPIAALGRDWQALFV